MVEEINNERHTLAYEVPTRLPQFDTAFAVSSNKEGLKMLVKSAKDSSTIVLVSDGVGVAYALRLLNKRNFSVYSASLLFDLESLTFTGKVVFIFVRDPVRLPEKSKYFCLGPSYLYEQSYLSGTVIDLFCLGVGFYNVVKTREDCSLTCYVE